MKKVCTKCGIEKELGEFHKQKGGECGVRGECKDCRKEYREQNKEKFKEYREKNKEKKKEYSKEWREKNKEKIKEKKKKYNKKYREKNKEKKKKYNKKYRDKNKEKIKEYSKEWRGENKEKIKEYMKEYRQSEHGRMVCKINGHKRRVRKKEACKLGTYTIKEWKEAMQFFNNKCAWSGKVLTDKNESTDHINPINKGGTNNINNVVPCDRSINSSKNDSDWEEWYPKQPFYSKEREKKIREWIELKTAISLFD